MENKIQVFENSEFGSVRIIEQNGEPWFVAADVCRALELDPTATRRLDDDEKNILRLTQGTSGNPNATMISEAGLYTLILGSRKPEAKQFKRWVFDELIPKIKSQQKHHEIVSNGGVQTFKNTEFGEMKTIEENGEVLFCANDVAASLGYARPRDAISAHCKGAVKRRYLSNGGEQETSFIPESDLYRLAFSSKLAAAERFTDWVTKDVLPTIRKHGMYVNEELLFDPDLAIAVFQALKDERVQRKALEATVAAQHEQISVMKPKATYCDQILQCENAMPITIIAKDYGMSATALNRKLNELRIQYKRDETWVLYQKYAGQGYISTETFWYESNGRKKARISTKWTQKGRLFLYDRLKAAGILPECEENDSEKNTALVS